MTGSKPPTAHEIVLVAARSKRSIGCVRDFFAGTREPRSTTVAAINEAIVDLGLVHLRRDRAA